MLKYQFSFKLRKNLLICLKNKPSILVPTRDSNNNVPDTKCLFSEKTEHINHPPLPRCFEIRSHTLYWRKQHYYYSLIKCPLLISLVIYLQLNWYWFSWGKLHIISQEIFKGLISVCALFFFLCFILPGDLST